MPVAMVENTASNKNRIRKSKVLVFMGLAFLVGFICAFKKIAYPVEGPDIIGLTYSRRSDILGAFFGGMFTTLLASVIVATILSVAIDRFFPMKVSSLEDLFERDSKRRKQINKLVLILWIPIAILKVIFTDAHDPIDFSKEYDYEEYYDQSNDDYFFK